MEALVTEFGYFAFHERPRLKAAQKENPKGEPTGENINSEPFFPLSPFFPEPFFPGPFFPATGGKDFAVMTSIKARAVLPTLRCMHHPRRRLKGRNIDEK